MNTNCDPLSTTPLRPGSGSVTTHGRRYAAFTIIELLVVISVIAVLLSLLLPALGRARILSRQMVALSNLKSIGTTFELYTVRHDGTHPWHDRDTMYDYHPDRVPTIRTGNPFAMRYLWPSVMHEVAPWAEHFGTWVNPGVQHAPGKPWLSTNGYTIAVPSYFYCNSFVARPRVWSATTMSRLPTKDGHAPTRAHEVLFPSSKAVFFDLDRAYLQRPATYDDPRPVLARDLAASKRFDGDATEPIQNRLTTMRPVNYSDTRDGVRGRDW